MRERSRSKLCCHPLQNRWGWTTGFVPAGHVGDAEIEDASGSKRKRGFDENDQERLAMAAHDSANRGKRGLGVGSQVLNSLELQMWIAGKVKELGLMNLARKSAR